MLPALRLPLLMLAVLLVSTPAAHAAKGLSLAVPAEGQVAVAVAGGAKSVKVKSAPPGVTVAGGVKRGRLAVAVIRPRGVAAAGKVVFTLRGRAKGVKTFPAALDAGRASAGCADLGALLGKRLKGSADVKALGAVLAAKLCGKPAPDSAPAVLAGLGLGAPPAPTVKPGAGGMPGAGGTLTRPGSGRPTPPPPTPTPTPEPGGDRPCDNDLDDDGDGQVDWADPGCTDAGDGSETGEVPVSAECAANSGIGMGDDPTRLGAGINSGCGSFDTIEIDVAPGVASCRALTADDNFDCTISAPLARAVSRDGRPTDMADVMLELSGPVQCDVPATIALYRPNGEVAELREPVGNCGGPVPRPACSNGTDDDADGMTDSRDAAGTTDPDPGCSGPTDTTENSETPTPATCDIQIGLLDANPRLPGLTLEGCGVLTGVWFKPPGTPGDCVYQIAGEDALQCSVKAGTGGVTFPATNAGLALVTPLTAEAICTKVTVALTRADGSVIADRVDWC